MIISEVRIKLMENSQERLLAFCSITIDGCFVVRDVKIIKGTRGPFVAMPSRKLCDRCSKCGCKNYLRSCFCSGCGVKLGEDRSLKDHEGRAKLYADIAHPINSECRDKIQHHVIRAYDEELELAKQPGYVCRYDDFGEEGGDYDEGPRWDDAVAVAENGERRRLDAGATNHSRPHDTNAKTANNHRRDTRPRREDFGDGVF